MCADVVIVGGGPVGCWTAIQLKRRDPNLNIRIYEKSPVYQRQHMMSIKRSSFERYTSDIEDDNTLLDDIKSYHHDLSEIGRKNDPDKQIEISTQDLEKTLKTHCENMGVNFTYDSMKNPKVVMSKHPECSLFIAADGTHSRMRTALLEKGGLTKTFMHHAIDISYQVKGQAQKLGSPRYDLCDYIAIETLEKEKDGVSTLGLRFLVDENDIKELPKTKKATLKDPLTFKDFEQKNDFGRKHIDGFGKTIQDFQEKRNELLGEEAINGTEQITKFEMNRYIAREFAVTKQHEDKDKAWFIVGDAAMAMPFYRSINSGLQQASLLAKIIAHDTDLNKKTKKYNATRKQKLLEEFVPAATKMAGINLYKNRIRPLLQTGKQITTSAGIVIIAPVFIVGLVAYVGVNKLLGRKVDLM